MERNTDGKPGKVSSVITLVVKMQTCIVVYHLNRTQGFDYMSFLKEELQVMQKTAPN